MQNRSQIAEAFGANVELKSVGSTLCLVVGLVSPIAAINAVNGSIVVTLSRTRVLAVIDIALLPQVQRHRDIALAGPVNVDSGRFARFAQLVGVNSNA